MELDDFWLLSLPVVAGLGYVIQLSLGVLAWRKLSGKGPVLFLAGTLLLALADMHHQVTYVYELTLWDAE